MIILVFCEVTNIRGLWDKHKNAMGEDYSRKNSNTASVEQQVLKDIRDMVNSMGKDFRSYGLLDLNDAGIFLLPSSKIMIMYYLMFSYLKMSN